MDRYQNAELTWGQPEWVDQVRDVIRWLRCSVRTEQGYVDELRFVMGAPCTASG